MLFIHSTTNIVGQLFKYYISMFYQICHVFFVIYKQKKELIRYRKLRNIWKILICFYNCSLQVVIITIDMVKIFFLE